MQVSVQYFWNDRARNIVWASAILTAEIVVIHDGNHSSGGEVNDSKITTRVGFFDATKFMRRTDLETNVFVDARSRAG